MVQLFLMFAISLLALPLAVGAIIFLAAIPFYFLGILGYLVDLFEKDRIPQVREYYLQINQKDLEYDLWRSQAHIGDDISEQSSPS